VTRGGPAVGKAHALDIPIAHITTIFLSRSRHCERSEAIHGLQMHGLPHCARSDEATFGVQSIDSLHMSFSQFIVMIYRLPGVRPDANMRHLIT
jgi:hypothetical protein